MALNKKKKTWVTWIVGLYLFLVVGSLVAGGGRMDPQSLVQSFTPVEQCDSHNGIFFSGEDAARCIADGCHVENQYVFDDTPGFFTLTAGLAGWAGVAGICTLWGGGAGGFTCTPVEMAVVGGITGLTVATTATAFIDGFTNQCVSCIDNGGFTPNGAVCCSGYSVDVPRDVVSGLFLGSPKVCVPANYYGGKTPINQDGFLCQLGRPVTEMLGLNDCVTGAYVTLGLIALLLIAVVVLFL